MDREEIISELKEALAHADGDVVIVQDVVIKLVIKYLENENS